MATNKNPQRLQDEAIKKREELVVKNDYMNAPDKVYNSQNKDALSDGDPLGKGTGVPLGVAPKPGEVNSKAISYQNFDAEHGGGLYDIKGRNGVGGRERLMVMNLYNKENKYGPESVDTTENVLQGQIKMTPRALNHMLG